jgi:hypothetical protein
MSQATIAQPLPAIDFFKPATPYRPLLNRAAFWSVFAFIVTAALISGLILRRYAWDQTEPIRYILDINNAFQQGSDAIRIGYVDRYDEQTSRKEHVWFMDLDYAPGRLAIATLWTHWVREKVDGPITNPKKIHDWQFYPRVWQLQQAGAKQGKTPAQFSYELCKPLLMVNMTGEILSAIAMFFLVRRYTSGTPPDVRPTRGIILGLISALFFWFNPALIWNAHCWPQWDSWVLPFFLWALVLASLDWWFCAGAIIATGAMFKGQILFGAPLFLLWPLFQGRLPAVARWISGLLTATAAITAVWLVRIPGTTPDGGQFIPGSTNPHAIEWVVYLSLIFAAMVSMFCGTRKRWMRFPIGVLVAAVITWLIAAYSNHEFSVVGFIVLAAVGWFADEQFAGWDWRAQLPLGWIAAAILILPIYKLTKDWSIVGAVMVATGAMGMLLHFAPRRTVPYAGCAWIAVALLTCMPLFKTSTGWFDLGIAYGTHHYEKMASGDNNNLAELLQKQWGWDDLMAPVFTLPKGDLTDSISSFLVSVDPGVKAKLEELKTPDGGFGLPLKYLMVSVWVISLILCSIAASVHDRNRSPRFLIAVVTPWIVFFAVMTQMHQRYLLWGASLSAATVAISPGYAMLNIFLSIVAMSQEMNSMFADGRYNNHPLHHLIEQWHPGVSWAVLLTAGIFLYTTLKVRSLALGIALGICLMFSWILGFASLNQALAAAGLFICCWIVGYFWLEREFAVARIRRAIEAANQAGLLPASPRI